MDSGLGTMLSTTSLSKLTLTSLITGDRESARSWIIFSEGSSWSPMKVCDPLPLSAQPKISYSEQPSPTPIVWTLEYLLLSLTILITSAVFLTPPSVRRKICFGYPYFGFEIRSFFSGLSIYVPPMFAFIVLIYSTAWSTYLSAYSTAWWKILLSSVPKQITLKYEF